MPAANRPRNRVDSALDTEHVDGPTGAATRMPMIAPTGMMRRFGMSSRLYPLPPGQMFRTSQAVAPCGSSPRLKPRFKLQFQAPR